MKISKSDLKAIGQDLDKRQPPKLADDIDQDMSLKEIITTLAPKLLRIKRRKFTTDGMVEVLKENHINIDGRTLNRYLNDFQAARKKKTVQDATVKPKPIKSIDGKDGFTSKEKMPSGQTGLQVAARADPLQEVF